MADAVKLLIVEDEKNVGSTLVERLKQEGFDIAWAKTFAEAHHEVSQRKFQLALLDVGLPDGSGFDLAKIVRQQSKGTAIIFLTAFANPDDRIRGLELGAEDYVVKPFHFKELLLRIQNALKRAKFFSDLPGTEEAAVIGRATIHFSKFEAHVGKETHPLTHKECALLKFLAERRGKVVSRDEILNFVWSENEFPTSRTVDNFVLKLRKIVEIDPENPVAIKSVRGVGYQLI
ncbi:MAG: response regulator transcription factor [Bacteriovoracia bacterium]